ncbi:MAG TPA: hypothetical protein VKV36_03620 [Acidimicrobiales bacterium]|nr:hypothetical protein [Acidimicrobiales bacterium]
MSRHHDLKKRTSDLLSSLGGSRSQVATALAEARVTGTPGNAEQCPIASYLNAVMGAEPEVRSLLVGTRRLVLTLHGRRRPMRILMPRPVREFVVAFDARVFPGLIRQPAGSPQPAVAGS